MEVDDQRSEMEAPPPDPSPSRLTIAVPSSPSAANGNLSGAAVASTSSVQQIVRVPIGQLQIGARQLQQQQQQQQQGQPQGHARLVLRTQQQQPLGQDQQQYRAIRHVRPPTWLATQNAQQRQRVPPIAANHVVGTRPLPSASQHHQPPNLLQVERNREQQQRRQFQLSRGPDSEFKLSLPTRCVRFGTYKLSCQRPLEVTSEHINLVVVQDVPNARRYDDSSSHYQQASRTSSIAFVISFKHIRRVEYSFTNGNSVMYLLVNDYCGRKIRESLGIDTELEVACADQTLSYFNPDSPYLYHHGECTWMQYKKCSLGFTADNASDCMDKCLPFCERKQYALSRSTKYISNKCQAEYIIYTTSFQYVVYSEQFAWSFWSVVAALGGTLGLWLGLDAIFFIDGFLIVAHRILLVCGCRQWFSQTQNMTSVQPLGKTNDLDEPQIKIQPAVEMELQSM